MKENNENMKQFAQPNFPAQDAWNGMQKILNTEMPVEEKPKKRFVFFWLLGLILLGTGAYFYIDKNSTKLADANTIKFNDTNTFKESITNAILENKSINSASENGAITKSNASVSQSAATANRIENIANSNPIIASKSYSNTFKGIAFNANHFNKLGYEKASNILFANAPSFNDIRRMKIAKGEVSFENAITDNFIAETIADTDVSKNVMINPTKESVKESKIKSITKPIQNAIAESAVKMPKNMNLQTLHYGLQWNVVLPQTNSYLNYNAQSQPITIAIPEFWVSKHLSRKSELSLQLNPYSQYTLKGNNVLASTNYPITISQGTGQSPTTTNYVHTRSLVKAMGVELTAKYTYKVNDKFSVALGLGNNWLSAAVVNEKIKGNSDKVVRDSLYGIAKGFKDWNYLKSSFFVGRLEVLYQLKNIQLGVAFLKPLGNLYSFENTNTNPVNGRLVLRWKIK